jgi:hypothetical protein
MIFVTIVTAQNVRSRARIVLITGIVSVVSIIFVLFLLSLPEVRTMLTERAHLFQSYDVGERFPMQRLAVDEILDSFNGLGPFGFASRHVNQQHNVYLQAFLVYGWLGGVTFIVLVISTLTIGFKSAFVATEWQPYVITALAAFIGEMAEGFIIDSDHWRHLFLLLGILWGLWAATARYVRRRSHPQFMTSGYAARYHEHMTAYRS